MARFIFPMENLLNMKIKLEDQAKNEYSQANMNLSDAEYELESLKNRQLDAEEKLRNEVSDSLNVFQIRQKEDNVEIIKMYVRQQQLVVIQRQKEVDVARNKLEEAMKERKTFEKLKEKAFAKFIVEENKKEQKEVDEIVSYRYGSRPEN